MYETSIRNPSLTARNYAYELMLGTGLTRHPTDLQKCVIALRSASDPRERLFVMRLILEKRKNWLDWLTRTQREWQSSVSRRMSRQRHHDSWAAREKYVRCST